MTSKVQITPNELNRLVEWLKTLPTAPMNIIIEEGEPTGIGNIVKVYTTNVDGSSGQWKLLTDYSEW